MFRRWALAVCLLHPLLGAQTATPPEAPPKDLLGRSTPKGAVMGFLAAGHKGDFQAASQFLNTRLRGAAAERLAQQLFTVLDRRLPPRLQALSDSPEGSVSDLKTEQDLVGTISGAQGNIDILVERVSRGKAGALWLFSKETLDRIPDLFQEINAVSIDNVLPQFLTTTRIAGFELFQWLGVFVGLPAVYALTLLLNWILSRLAGLVRRRVRGRANLPDPVIVPMPARLILVALVIREVLTKFSLPLLARQFWATTASLLVLTACVWLLLILDRTVEGYFRRRLVRQGNMAASSVVRLARRILDTLAVFGGLLVALHHFGVNPTAALAGLGVGGIAVALAAQRTLENVIGGISIIFDGAVRVGDTLKVGDALGTVIDIGLRSTRLRTLDRTIVSVPNGQIANLALENLTSRDKFWFHPNLKLRAGTTAAQLHSVLEALRGLLAHHPQIEPASARVQLLGFGAWSVDVEVFAYVRAKDSNHFLAVQGELLLRITEILEAAEIQFAFQPPTNISPPAAAA